MPTAPYNTASLNRYFYNIDIVSKSNESIDVVKYGVQSGRRAFQETDNWSPVEYYLLSAYRHSPTILPLLVEVFITRHKVRGDVTIALLTDFINARLPALARLQKNGEIVWFLFLSIALNIRILASAVEALFLMEDAAIALLVTDAYRLGLVAGSVALTLWNESLTEDGLNGPMWLYSYESALQNLNSVPGNGHIARHPYFRFLLEKGVCFYRSGSAHIDVTDILRRRRMENLRRRMQEAKLDENLGEDVDDFEYEAEDDDVEEDEDVY